MNFLDIVCDQFDELFQALSFLGIGRAREFLREHLACTSEQDRASQILSRVSTVLVDVYLLCVIRLIVWLFFGFAVLDIEARVEIASELVELLLCLVPCKIIRDVIFCED